MSNKKDMIEFIKSLADTGRLQVVGLLVQGPKSTLDISASLGISPDELSRPLEMLTSAGVLSLQDGLYSLDEAALEAFRVQQLHRPREFFKPPDYLSEEDSGIIRKLAAPDGSLKRLPNQLKHWMAVLRYVLPFFEPGTNYTEKQVNGLLMRFHHDTAVLRRFLVDTGMLGRERDGSRYWREVQRD
ncbi:MAG: DUF2087 domain-containing protein [Chloroflexota bacterium]